MKTNTVFKRTYNRSLLRLGEFPVGGDIGSEPAWANALAVSRTTVRAVLQRFLSVGLISLEDRRKALNRQPTPDDFFPEAETEQVGAIVEKHFMRWLLDGDCKPGQQINGLALARQFGVSTSAVRDYLNRFSRFGLLERRRSGSWAFKGFTKEFAEELFEVREMFELRSAQRFIAIPERDPAWTKLALIEREHLDLLEDAETRFADLLSGSTTSYR
jgi:DNA-binding GntR family transcriptional regulator